MNTQTETYTRVIPRDFFNEAKLLKCMGLLSLMILDNKTPCDIRIQEDGEPFQIELTEDGSLFVANYPVFVKDTLCLFKTTYNSKANYPLICEYDYCEYRVFDESGNWDEEFLEFINTL